MFLQQASYTPSFGGLGIKDAANTGKAGDGRIFVSQVAAAIRIDNGERDAASL